MRYELNEMLVQTRQLNFSGNIIPHSWYSEITFDSGKTDLISIVILAEIIYWYRPIEIKCERTGRLLGYKKKFHADMLQRSISSFADQFGLTKRQVSDALKRLEEGGLIIRELRTVETSQGKIGNVQYLAPIIQAISELDHGHHDDQLLGDDTSHGGDRFIPLPEQNTNDTPPHTIERNRGHVQMYEVSRSNVIAPTIKRGTYTETTTQITTKKTAADEKPKNELPAVTFSKNKIENADVLIGDSLTDNQLNLIQKTSIELSDHVSRSPEHLSKEIATVILSNTSFTNANRDFLKKLNTIKKIIKEGRWQTPVVIVEKKFNEQKNKVDLIKNELSEAELNQQHWEKMTAIFLEKGDMKKVDDFRELQMQAKKQVESIKSKYQFT